MDAPGNSGDRRGKGGVLLLVLLLLPVMYPLSIGPAYAIERQDIVSKEFLGTVYYPLEQLIQASPPVRRVFHWYIELWI